MSASPDEVCTKTSSGEVVCGKPVQNPGSSSKKPDSDETIQTEVDRFVTWELKSCARKQRIVSCIFTITPNAESRYDIRWYAGEGTKIVDAEGNEYSPNKVQIGKNFSGLSNRIITIQTVIGAHYQVIIDFVEVPASVPYITLLQVVGSDGGSAANIPFRNVPIINPDGSSAPVPDLPKTPVKQQSSNHNSPPPQICLPIVGCLHQ
ncbi:hypothetical protein [Nostoc sp.]|uniref:hypothetical protein n=1 Tax=Nostoc sp. TaxID=1180 RepID=UPI002FF4CDF9